MESNLKQQEKAAEQASLFLDRCKYNFMRDFEIDLLSKCNSCVLYIVFPINVRESMQ